MGWISLPSMWLIPATSLLSAKRDHQAANRRLPAPRGQGTDDLWNWRAIYGTRGPGMVKEGKWAVCMPGVCSSSHYGLHGTHAYYHNTNRSRQNTIWTVCNITKSVKVYQCKIQELIVSCSLFVHYLLFYIITLKVLVTTIDAQWEGMGDVGSARYEPALLPPCPTIRVLSYSN